jgi:thymidylate synthase
MTTNPFTFRNVTEALPVLCRHVMEMGDELSSRNGRVKELSPVQITLTHPWEREVLSAHRHASVAAQIAETMWVLAGRNDVEWLSHYLPRAVDFSDDGKTWRAGYGPRIRNWSKDYGQPVDQLKEVIDILREDPSSRRAVINIFDPALDFQESKDIPCNNWLHFLSRGGKLNLHVAIRSNDLMWGWSGINAFEWSVLQEIVASCLGIQMGTLTFSISSLHIYDKHWAKAEKIAQGKNDYRGLPLALRMRHPAIKGERPSLQSWDSLIGDFFTAEKYIREGAATQDIHIRAVKHPSIRSMLRVLQHYWGGDIGDIGDTLTGEALWHAVVQSPNGGLKTKPQPVNTPFIEDLIRLHNEKHAAYGDSWKKRGEAVSIQANIARKVDRLGGGDTSDETQADTAGDLLVYLAKYLVWIGEMDKSTVLGASDGTEHPNAVLRSWDRQWQSRTDNQMTLSSAERKVKGDFEKLLGLANWELKRDLVIDLAADAYALAKFWADKADDQYRGADHD